MNVFVFTGFLGSGKTLGAVLYAKKYQALSGCALYSNIAIEGAKPFYSLETFKEIAQESSSILLLDEAHMDLDARSFNTNHVKFFTQLSYYLRKLRCTLFITSPNFADLDSRIRGITNILAIVSKSKGKFFMICTIYNPGNFYVHIRWNNRRRFTLPAIFTIHTQW